MRRPGVVLAVIVGALLVASACGVPSHDTAEKTNPKDVPFGLLDENSGVEPEGLSSAEGAEFGVMHSMIRSN